MLPEALLQRALVEGSDSGGSMWIPRYLGASDYPWLQALLQLYSQMAGKRRSDLDERFRGGAPVNGPVEWIRRARYVLDRLCVPSGAAPREAASLREELFVAAAERDKPRSQVVKEMAARLGMRPDAVFESLFADLPGERRVLPPPGDLSPTELALRINLALVQGLCARSILMAVDLWGNARSLVRLAHLRGLLCTARPLSACTGVKGPAVQLLLSGPLSLFRRTRVYGRTLASLVSQLCWCERFELRITLQGEGCQHENGHGEVPRRDAISQVVRVASGAPIFPSSAPKLFDSRVEERFARDFTRMADDWELVREPAPVQAGGRLIFPDFAIQHRRDSTQVVLLEIVGFWTADYLRDKLTHLRAANVTGLILCIDERRDCGGEELPPHARVIRYRRWVDPKQVLALLDGDDQ